MASGVLAQGLAHTHAKVASSQAILASSGALQNITALLPPALVPYVDATIGRLSDTLAGSSEFLEAQGISPTIVYSTLACAALALPIGMSRYFYPGRSDLSPFASQPDSRGPYVTEDDFSYITSEDLERSLDSRGRHAESSNGREEDDVLLVKSEAVIYPIHFPAFSIGDGKLYVRDVRDRVGLVLELSRAQTSRIRLYYKGRQLKELEVPIRTYGVKNNSELLLVIPDSGATDDESDSSEEEVIVKDPRDQQQQQRRKKKKGKSGNKKKKSSKSQRDEEPSAGSNLDIPGSAAESTSGAPSRHPSRVPSPSVPSGAVAQLDAIRNHFESELAPLCRSFMADPPRDPKKCEDEHRKISETVLQHVILKLDEVDTGGDPDIRAKRKALVNYVQGLLNDMDKRLPAGVKANR
ncbi:BAG domain-containing protein [Microdochium trichocladiopsis]|uniref:BAG domain-containing protein n=1 Tax=Microdochium trichocladiopsis TaxID=1682393 RepID=A0A9P8Y7Q1_9PEZI|nr:BAG domain-containing protein [Microdochium trichocladiopsis]KAH7032704.1 BAG domain-containing protein [Microdochium trichocladiopsis]